MSGHADTGHGAHGDHGAHDYHGASFKGYMTGFILSVILTAIPFWLVMTGVLENKNATAIAIVVFAAVQIVVHMVYFLHMNGKAEGGWTFTAMIFTIIIVVIVLSGSLWVMYHLHANMMPVPHDMNRMP